MIKRLISSLLALVMCLVLSSTAFAAEGNKDTTKGNVATDVKEETLSAENANIVPFSGAETWGKTSSFKNVGTFTMEGNNLTPVKTMGANGNLSLKLDNANVVGSLDSINLRIEVRSHATQKVLKSWTFYDFWGISNTQLSGSVKVNKGDQIQIYFRVYDADTGNYNDNRQVNISYSYKLQ